MHAQVYEYNFSYTHNTHESTYDPQVWQHCIDEIITISDVFQRADS